MPFGTPENCTGDESVSTMWVEDKRKLCRALDARSLWKDLASHRDLNVAQEDVQLLARKEAVQSPTDGLLHLMANKRTSMLDLFHYLKQSNLLSAMEIVKKYVPPQYHACMQDDPVPEPTDTPCNPINLEPAPPPALSEVNSSTEPQRLMSPLDLLDSSGADDSLFSSLPELTSTQKRAAHTIIATRHFDIEEIREATDNFHERFLIAKGRYSSIYRVNLLNTKFAAKIYRLDYNAVLSDLQDTRLHNHENIVPITGKCLNGDNVIVLYELMTNGSLRDLLKKGGVINMETRLAILRDAARGLQYLHGNKPPLIHRNIKSQNILLDDSYKAKLSDFGLAVHANKSDSGPSSQCYTHFSTREDTSVVQRSKGYCAREVLNGKFTPKSDTYAFGVVILEVCTGQQAFDESKRVADQELANYVENHVQSEEDEWELADKSCRWARQTYHDLFRLGQKCIAERAKCRPSMNQVYKELDEIIAQKVTNVYRADPSGHVPSRSELSPPDEPLTTQSMIAPGELMYPANMSTMYQPHSFPQYHPNQLSQMGYAFPPQQGLANDSQTSESNNSIGDLDFSSMSGGRSSVPLSSHPAADKSHDISTEVVQRTVQQAEEEYIENPTPPCSADYANLNPSPGKLLDILKKEADRRQGAVSSEEDEPEEGAELNPELLPELAMLDLAA